MFRIAPPPALGHLLAEDLAAPVDGLEVAVDHAVPVLVLHVEIGLSHC